MIIKWLFKKFYPPLAILIITITVAVIVIGLIFLVSRVRPATKVGIKNELPQVKACQTEIDYASIDSMHNDSPSYRNEIFIELPEPLLFCGQEFSLTCYSDSLQFFKAMAYFLDRPHLVWTYMLFFSRYLPWIERILQDNDLPDDLRYIPIVESSLSLRVKSSAGAVGYWQFIRSTAIKYGLIVTQEVDQRLDPILASHAAAKYFGDIHNEFSDWILVVSAYNAGEGRIRRALKKHEQEGGGLISLSYLSLPAETKNYSFLITAFKVIYENSEMCHISAPFPVEPLEFDTVTIKIRKKNLIFSEIASVCGVTVPIIRDLNPSFLKNKIPPGQWTLYLPKGTCETFLAKFGQ